MCLKRQNEKNYLSLKQARIRLNLKGKMPNMDNISIFNPSLGYFKLEYFIL